MTRFAGQIDLTDYLGEGDDWSAVGDATSKARSSNEIADIEAQSLVSRAGISSVAAAEAAKASAAATVSAGRSKADAMLFGGIMDGIGTLGSAGISAYGRANKLGKYAEDDE